MQQRQQTPSTISSSNRSKLLSLQQPAVITGGPLGDLRVSLFIHYTPLQSIFLGYAGPYILFDFCKRVFLIHALKKNAGNGPSQPCPFGSKYERGYLNFFVLGFGNFTSRIFVRNISRLQALGSQFEVQN